MEMAVTVHARRLSLWVGVFAYAALIFWGSSRSWSLPRVGPGVDISPLLHAVEFGILGALIFLALRDGGVHLFRARRLAVALTLLYGVSDEIHQMMVPGRHPSVIDLLADGLGALVAVRVVSALRNG